MSHKLVTNQQAATCLLQVLNAPDELNCDQAQALLPAFTEDEHVGVNVESLAEYASLLLHLDRCENCMKLYILLAEDLELQAQEGEGQPQLELTPPMFFTPARQGESVVLRVLGGIARLFELDLAIPKLAPSIKTLGEGQRVSLFNSTVTELDGAPLVSVSLLAEAGMADMIVAVREPATQTRWLVQLIEGDSAWVATTDEQGITRFTDLAVAGLEDVTLSFAEIAGEV